MAEIRTCSRFIDVLVICKYEEDPIKNQGARVLTRLYDIFFRRLRAANSEVSSGILPKFELSKLLKLSSLPARMKKIQSKMKELEC